MIKLILLEQTFDTRRSALDDLYYPRLMDIVNEITDWKNTKFPVKKEIKISEEVDENNTPKLTEEETVLSDFLGDDPKLKPGIVFLLEKQALSFRDNNTISLLSSETGGFGLCRIINEVVLTEYKLLNKIDYIRPVTQNAESLENNRSKFYDYLKLPYYSFERVNKLTAVETQGMTNLTLPFGVQQFIKRNCAPIESPKQFEVTLNYFPIPIILQVSGKGEVSFFKDSVPFEDTKEIEDLIKAISFGLISGGYLY